MSTLWRLGVGDSPNVYIDLGDGVHSFVLADRFSISGAILPAGGNWGGHERGITRGKTPAPEGTRTLTYGLIGAGVDPNDVEWNWNHILDQLERARLAVGPYGRGGRLTLTYLPDSVTTPVIFDVVNGDLVFQYMGLIGPEQYKGEVLTLYCMPYGRGPAITDPVSGTLTNGSLQSRLYRHNVPGNVDALVHTQVADTGSSRIVRLTLGHRSANPMLATDFSGIYPMLASSPGTSTTDGGGNYTGGAFARVAASGAWQTVAKASEPSGAFQTGEFLGRLRVRQSDSPLVMASSPAAFPSGAGGTLREGTYSAYLTTKDGSGHESLPLALPAAVVPLVTTTFFDGAEGGNGDDLLWPIRPLAVLQPNPLVIASIEADASAVYPWGIPSALGYKVTAGGGTFIGRYQPYTSGTKSIRFNANITTDGTIPLVVDSANSPIIFLGDDGANNFQLYTHDATSGVQALPGSNLAIIPEHSWITVEVVATYSGAGEYTISLYLNDLLLETKTTSTGGHLAAPAGIGFGSGVPFITSSMSTGATYLIDNIQIGNSLIGANTGSIAYTWLPPGYSGGTGYNLYISREAGPWQQIAISTLSTAAYTLTSNTVGTQVNPPSTMPVIAPALYRLAICQHGADPTKHAVYTRPVPTNAAQANWEMISIGPFPAPPQVAWQDGTQALWDIYAQVKSGSTNTPNCDVNYLSLFPVDDYEALLKVWAPGFALPSAGTWIIDQRYDDEVSCQIQNGGNVIAQAECQGRWTYGHGDNLIIIDAEVANPSAGGPPVSDVPNTAFTYGPTTIRPRYEHAIGLQPSLLTASGNEITDVARWQGLAGDGLAYPQRTVGIWKATTNLRANGSFETGTTGYLSSDGAAVIAQSTTNSVFGTHSLGVTTTSASNGARTTGDALTSGTVYTVGVWVTIPVGKSAQLRVYRADFSTIVGTQTFTGTGLRQFVSLTFTAPATETEYAYVTDTSGTVYTFQADGWQTEVSAYATPFAGDGVTRPAARVQVPVGNPWPSVAQGCVAKAFLPGWGSGETGVHTLFSLYKDASNFVRVYWDGARHFICETMDAGTSVKATSALQTFSANTVLCIIANWAPTGPSISVGGVAFVTNASRVTNFVVPVNFDIGSHNGTQQEDGNDAWDLWGTGSFGMSDVVYLNGLGTAKPARSALSPVVSLSGSWFADSSQYGEG